MEEDLFCKIIDELAIVNFSGRFSPHFYGEPLLDKRIVSFITYTRKRLPNVFIKLYTNGDLLSYELFMELLDAGADIFRISQHGEMPSKILSECKNKVGDKMWRERVEYLRYVDTDTVPLMNRGGIIDTNRGNRMKSCEQVFDLIIDYEGNVLLCCQDFLSKNIFGNLKNEGIMEIWNKKHFKSLRDKINSGIWSAEICKKCVDAYQE
jgi:8-amino-3,8-dideoxy-alpha-D-manno-octulosonate transaminase